MARFAMLAAACAVMMPVAAIADTPADAARLESARAVVLQVFPQGTYMRLMNGAMSGMMSKMVDSMSAMPMADLARLGGANAETVAQMDKASIADVMAILDPAFKERTQTVMQVMMPEMGHVMGDLEPDVREGLAQAYANRFTTAQLADMHSFFATPSGSAYAAQSMLLYTDPAVMARMQALMPKLMQAIPGIMEKAQAATAKLPKPRKYDELSDAEKAKLDAILGPHKHEDQKK